MGVVRARRGLAGGGALLVAVGTFVGGLPAADAADTAIVAALGSSRTGEFATPVMAVQPGTKPTVVNLDIVWHGIESEEVGADDRAWCVAVDPKRPEDPVSNPRRKPLGECPLFWSDYASVGGTAPVLGLEGVEAGKVYAYQCTVVPGMGGNLFVV